MKTKAVGCINKGIECRGRNNGMGKQYLSQSHWEKTNKQTMKKRFYWAEKPLYSFMMRCGCYRFLGNVIRKRALLITTSLRDGSMS